MVAEIVEQERKGRFGNGGFHTENPRGLPVTNWDNIETTKYPRSIVDKALDVFLANRSKAKELWGAVSTLQQMRDSVGKVAWPDNKENIVVDVTATPIGKAATEFQSLVAQFMDKLRTEAEYKGLDGRNDLGIGVRYIPNHSQPRTARSAKAYCGLNELQQDSIERSRCFKVGKLWTSDRQADFKALIAEYQLFTNAAIL
jgi:hypothetical protein